MTNNHDSNAIPLCVDLDGTLIYSDVLYEVLLVLLRKNVFYLLLLPLWVLKGKAHFKHQIAAHCELDPATLPYNQPLIDWLREQREAGRPLVLATATHAKFADAIAAHVGIFDQVLATDEHINLSGHRKLERLKQEFGSRGFDYVGNGHIDLDVWPEARRAIVVNPDAGVLAAAEQIAEVEQVFPAHGRQPWFYLHSLRLHHWAKNLLLLLPLLLVPHQLSLALVVQALVGFIAFSLTSSAAYILNDLLDLPYDRGHQHKQHRPLAASTVPLLHGMLMVPALLLPALLMALWLPLGFLLVLGVYLLVNAAYSLWLKQFPGVDVLVLASLYLLRLLAGAAAIGMATLPPLLIAVAALGFLSLAAAKRYAGLFYGDAPLTTNPPGRRYRKALTALGIGSGLLAALLPVARILSDQTSGDLGHPALAWLLAATLLLFVARLWTVTRAGRLFDDPVLFALSDHWSQALIAVSILGGWWLIR